jgi:superfamily II DNA/RNA helicase
MIVDEADRMLDLGFQDDIEAIHQLCSDRGQTLMFSATFAPRIMQLATSLMNNPGRIELANAHDKHENISQTLHWADSVAHKHKLLSHWLSDPTMEQAVVFASTQVDSEAIADSLRADGYDATALHGAMPQAVRNRRLQSLRKGQTRILVATDVAARGIDVPTITHVINFGLPMKAEDYVHRIGRTGRAGRSGVAITLAEHRDRSKIRAIEQYTQQPLQAEVIPGLEPSEKSRKPSSRPGAGRPGRSFGGKGASNASNRHGQGQGFGQGQSQGQGQTEGKTFKQNHFAKPAGPKFAGSGKPSSGPKFGGGKPSGQKRSFA